MPPRLFADAVSYQHKRNKVITLVVTIHKEKTLDIEVLRSGYLYHYTNIEALKNILEKKSIWISNISCLNDYSEMFYTYEIIEKRLERVNLIKLANKENCYDNYPDGYEDAASCFYDRLYRFERLLKSMLLKSSKNSTKEIKYLFFHYQKKEIHYPYGRVIQKERAIISS